MVDDGSTDNTEEIVCKYTHKLLYLRLLKSTGPGNARNVGITASQGDWIAFLDADDEWLPSKLFLQTDIIKQNPHLRWCGTNYYLDDGKKRTPAVNTRLVEKYLTNKGCFNNYFNASANGRNSWGQAPN